jgi:hypothetical protein
MKRLVIPFLAMVAIVATPASVSANVCPVGFHLHPLEDGDHDHGEHRHVGLSMDTVDLNGNGDICVKHVTPDGRIHVHIDDIA